MPLTPSKSPGLLWGLAVHDGVAERVIDDTAADILARPHDWCWMHFALSDHRARRFIETFPESVTAAEAAIAAEGLELKRTPIRGGTDGSRLSEKGLPTPNLFTGGHDYHSPREWASLREMAAAAATVVRLAEVWTQPELRAAALGAAPLPR